MERTGAGELHLVTNQRDIGRQYKRLFDTERQFKNTSKMTIQKTSEPWRENGEGSSPCVTVPHHETRLESMTGRLHVFIRQEMRLSKTYCGKVTHIKVPRRIRYKANVR